MSKQIIAFANVFLQTLLEKFQVVRYNINMIVYRYLSVSEFQKILSGDTWDLGNFYARNFSNTHKYKLDVRYMHFFKNIYDLPYIQSISRQRPMCLCQFDMPLLLLIRYMGKGFYDFSGYDNDYQKIREFAIPTELFNSSYLVSATMDHNRKLTPEEAIVKLAKNKDKMYEVFTPEPKPKTNERY